MDVLTNPIEELIKRYRSENKIIEIDQNARDNKDITPFQGYKIHSQTTTRAY